MRKKIKKKVKDLFVSLVFLSSIKKMHIVLDQKTCASYKCHRPIDDTIDKDLIELPCIHKRVHEECFQTWCRSITNKRHYVLSCRTCHRSIYLYDVPVETSIEVCVRLFLSAIVRMIPHLWTYMIAWLTWTIPWFLLFNDENPCYSSWLESSIRYGLMGYVVYGLCSHFGNSHNDRWRNAYQSTLFTIVCECTTRMYHSTLLPIVCNPLWKSAIWYLYFIVTIIHGVVLLMTIQSITCIVEWIRSNRRSHWYAQKRPVIEPVDARGSKCDDGKA